MKKQKKIIHINMKELSINYRKTCVSNDLYFLNQLRQR